MNKAVNLGITILFCLSLQPSFADDLKEVFSCPPDIGPDQIFPAWRPPFEELQYKCSQPQSCPVLIEVIPGNPPRLVSLSAGSAVFSERVLLIPPEIIPER